MLLAPLRANAAVIAKQALSLHALSGGRLTLGIGLGGRDDDYEVAGVETGDRGEGLDEMLTGCKELWEGDTVGPETGSAPTPARRRWRRRLLRPRRQLRRRLDRRRRAAGRVRRERREKVKAEWAAAGREGQPRLAGPRLLLARRRRRGERQRLPDRLLRLARRGGRRLHRRLGRQGRGDGARAYLAAFEGAGCDELILFPRSSDPAQVDLLADAAGL